MMRDDRSVAVTLNYVLSLGISALLVTGLLIAGGSFVEDQRERVIESELTVMGNHLAGNVEQVDRYVQASDGTPDKAYVNQTFQRSVTGANYQVTFQEDPDQLVFNTTRPQISVRVNVSVETDLDTDSSSIGGTISIYYDPNNDELVIDDV